MHRIHSPLVHVYMCNGGWDTRLLYIAFDYYVAFWGFTSPGWLHFPLCMHACMHPNGKNRFCFAVASTTRSAKNQTFHTLRQKCIKKDSATRRKVGSKCLIFCLFVCFGGAKLNVFISFALVMLGVTGKLVIQFLPKRSQNNDFWTCKKIDKYTGFLYRKINFLHINQTHTHTIRNKIFSKFVCKSFLLLSFFISKFVLRTFATGFCCCC